MVRLLLILLATAVVAPATPTLATAQEGPEEIFRAYWTSGLTPADPEAERFRSRASLDELAGFLAEEPDMAQEVLEFMTFMHRALHSAADIETVEVVEDGPDRVTLDVRFRGRDGLLPGDLPDRASVEMVREPEGWKIHSEAYSGAGRSSAGVGGAERLEGSPAWVGETEWDDNCGEGSVLGDPGAPHVLVLQGSRGEGRVHLPDAHLLLNEGALTLEISPFHGHELRISALENDRGPGRYEATLTLEGVQDFGGCPAPPARLFGATLEGEVEWVSGPEPGRADATFAFRDPETGETLVSGALQGAPVIDVSPGPLLEGSAMLFFDEEVAPTLGSVFHEPEHARLKLMLEYSAPSGGGSRSIWLEGFTGESGILLGDPLFGRVQVTLVREFDGSRLSLEVREVDEDQVGDVDTLAERFSSLGVLHARVRTDRVLRVTPLSPVLP